MELIIILTKILLLSKFIVGFEPLQWVLEAVELKKLNILKYFLIVITSCFKCASFWIGWIISGDVFIAAGASFIAVSYTNVEQNIISYLWKRKK
jgi:hypothetical protein